MKLFKTDYDDSYFNTFIETNPLLKKEIKEKVELIKSCKKQGDLLEIGCGDGILLNKIQDCYNVTGADISQHAIKKACEMVDSKKLKVMDIENEDIDGSYDIIIAFDVMEHLNNPQKVIKKIKGAMKKDGIFIFSVPNNYGIFGKIMTKIFNLIDKTHVSTYEREKWIILLNNSNLKTEIINHGIFGYQKKDIAKHFSFNMIVIATM